ncbi:MAG: hypothetical protein E5W76_12290 [Mesorhizobium sp.]|nr:MAG: hypothetical protein E5W76_12290 [Mesorhizobium sp.]
MSRLSSDELAALYLESESGLIGTPSGQAALLVALAKLFRERAKNDEPIYPVELVMLANRMEGKGISRRRGGQIKMLRRMSDDEKNMRAAIAFYREEAKQHEGKRGWAPQLLERTAKKFGITDQTKLANRIKR